MILTLVNNLFSAFILHVYNMNLFGCKDRKKYSLLLAWIVVAFVFSFQIFFTGKQTLIKFFLFAIPYIIVTKIYYNATLKRIMIYILYFYIGGILCEILSFCVINYIFKLSDNNSLFEPVIQVVSNIILFAAIRGIIGIIKPHKDYELKLINVFEVMIVPLGSIYLIVSFFKNSIYETEIDIIIIIIILLFNIITYFFYTKMLESVKNEYKAAFLTQRNQEYIEECNRVTELWKRINEFQHDMKYKSDVERLEYEKFISATGFGKMLSDSGCVVLDAIINSRAQYAEQNKIKIELINKLAIDSFFVDDDFALVLYNLLDNAIEANLKLKTDRYIKIVLESDLRNERTLFVCIENPYIGTLKKNKNGEYTTEKKDKHAHGIGLRSVKQIVEKHNGVIKIEDGNSVFCVQLMLFDMIM